MKVLPSDMKNYAIKEHIRVEENGYPIIVRRFMICACKARQQLSPDPLILSGMCSKGQTQVAPGTAEIYS